MHVFIAALLAATSCAGIAQANALPPAAAGQPLTLDRALALAGAASPAADDAEAGMRAANAGRAIAGLRPNPAIEAQAENIAGSGPYRGMSSSETTVSLALPVELGGKRSARIATAEARGGRARIEAAILLADLRFEIVRAYSGAVAAERRLAVADEQARIASEGLRVAETRVAAGVASPIERQRAAVVHLNGVTAVEGARRTAEMLRSNLARLIGRPVIGALDLAWFDRMANDYGPVAPVGAEGTLALAAAAAELAVAEAGVRQARTMRVPDLTLTAGARRLAASNDVAAVVGLSLPIPLFDGGSAAVDRARAERDQADARRRIAAITAEQAIAVAVADRANAAAKARMAGGPALDAAREAARIARIGYAQGKFGQIELLETERTLSETRATAIDALAAWHDADAQLIRLTTPAPDLGGEGR
jgi:cobalt-zinc-cadmium efflux system outer membrane protein